jgi:hypothetical protein
VLSTAREQLALGALILERQVAEHLRGERRQPGPYLRDLLKGHPSVTVQQAKHTPKTT